MISKCANPACSTPFHYLREGKLFRMEFDPARLETRPHVVTDHRPVRRVEHFWLCGACAPVMTLIMQHGTVTTVPLARPAARHAAAS